jgi:hypothetical protein
MEFGLSSKEKILIEACEKKLLGRRYGCKIERDRERED